MNTLEALMAKAKARLAEKEIPKQVPKQEVKVVLPSSSNSSLAARIAALKGAKELPKQEGKKEFTYNERQLEAIQACVSGENTVIIGAAGSGKTTTEKGIIAALEGAGRIPPLVSSGGHKHLKQGSPGILLLAFTRRAVNNIKKVMPEHIKANCMTFHKALEYEPRKVLIDSEDPETKEKVQILSQRFLPRRNKDNPLPAGITTVIIDEAFMLGIDLYTEFLAALPHKVQFIFLGDIQQIPPVFGQAAVINFLFTYKVVELTEVHRQALESPILELAHKTLRGELIYAKDFDSLNADKGEKGKLTISPWKQKLPDIVALKHASIFFKREFESGAYNPEDCIILTPFNKSFGTIELNKYIATFLAKKREVPVYEIITGFKTLYFSVGDRVLYDKEEYVIKEVIPNSSYIGKIPQKESLSLDYWGHNSEKAEEGIGEEIEEGEDWELNLNLNLTSPDEDLSMRTKQASHKILLAPLSQEEETQSLVSVTTLADYNSLELSYAITIHKSQGSEFRKVYLILHHTQAVAHYRELIYTGITRAKQELHIICEPDSLLKGIKNQRLKGNTLAEKLKNLKFLRG